MRQHSKVIDCQNVKKTFLFGSREEEVLHGVSFDIKAGELVVLFGPSGSGKSTLLHLIGGLERPTEGKILVRGDDISQFSHQQLARLHRVKIGFVFQQFNLISTLKVWENVSLPQAFAGVPKSRRFRRALHLLESLGLKDLAMKLPSELSGGEQQRVAIARALVNNPWILLVDEPTGNLDTKTGNEVIDILYQLNRRSRRTILLVTHNANYLKLAHRTIEIRDGSIYRERVSRFGGRRPVKLTSSSFGERLSEEELEKI